MAKTPATIYHRFTCGTRLGAIGCGHTWNLPEVTKVSAFSGAEYQDVERTPILCRLDDDGSRMTYHGQDAMDFRVLCPNCGISDVTEHKAKVRGRTGTNACESICETAEGLTCTCQCGGANHGVRA